MLGWGFGHCTSEGKNGFPKGNGRDSWEGNTGRGSIGCVQVRGRDSVYGTQGLSHWVRESSFAIHAHCFLTDFTFHT